MKSPPKVELTDEDRAAVLDLAKQGLTVRETSRELDIDGRQIAGLYRIFEQKGLVTPAVSTPSHKRRNNPPSSHANTGGVTEIVEAVDRLHELSEKIRHTGEEEVPRSSISELVQGVRELHELSGLNGTGGGNGQLIGAQGGLLEFLGTIVTQQDKSSQSILTQLQTQHTNDLERLDKSHEQRMEELKAKLASDKERERAYWERLDKQRTEENDRREKLGKEQQQLITDKLSEVSEKATENLNHAEELIKARQDSATELIAAKTEFSDQIIDLKKAAGGEDATKQLVELAIDRLGSPIVKAIEGRTGGASASTEKPSVTSAAQKAGGGEVFGAGKLKEAILNSFKDYIKEGLEQAVKHLQKWPAIPIDAIADLLWGARMYADVGTYAQAACTFVVLNDLDDFVKKAGKHLTADFRKAFSAENAQKWWSELQAAIVLRMHQEKATREAYAAQPQEEQKTQ